MATDRDSSRISAEVRNVPVHPFQGRLLVLEAVVAGFAGFRGQRRVTDAAEDAQAVVQRHDDDAAFTDDLRTVVLVGTAGGSAATMEEHVDRQMISAAGARGPL